jgi:methylmalonyl-CoA mutase N-terminal domain/subunit
LPTEESATIALRTQQILLHETGVVNTVDPVAGSYEIEQCTNTLERDALQLIERLDAAGGALSAIETGYVRQQIQEEAYRAQQAVDAGTAIVVGVNRFLTRKSGAGGGDSGLGTRDPVDSFFIDPTLEQQQIERLRAVRGGRSESDWAKALDEVDRAARDGSNLVPPIIAAAEKHATLGDIADRLRHVFGEYQDVSSS